MEKKQATFVFWHGAETDAVCNFTAVDNPDAKELTVTITIDGCNDTTAPALADLLREIAHHFDATAANGDEWAE